MWVLEDVKSACCNSQTKEAVSLHHLEHDKNKEDPNDKLRNSEPRDCLSVIVVALCNLSDVLVYNLRSFLLLLIVFVIRLLLCLFFNFILRLELLQLSIDFTREETEWSSKLINEDFDLSEHVAVALDLGLQHLYFVVPLKHFILLVSNLKTELGRSRITLTNVEPKLLVLWNDLSFDIIERYLGLKDSDASIDIEDLDNQWDLIVFNLELELWIGILRRLTARRSRLPMLVTLVADNVRVLHTSQVLSTDHSDE